MRLARVGNISVRPIPSSSIRARRGAGSRNAGTARIGSPKISRRDLPSGLPTLKYSSIAPGLATTSKVGLGMYSLIRPRIAIFVRPFTCTYWIAFRYSLGRYLVIASCGSYRWLSASNSG
jgi:hypothetical protein